MDFHRFLTIFIVIISLYEINGQWTNDFIHNPTVRDTSDSCMTPDRQPGMCINIQRCEELVEVLKKPGGPSQEGLESLRRHNCGFEGLDAKVCCPTRGGTPITITRTPDSSEVTPSPSTQSRAEVPPPDVSSHRNLELLPHTTCGPLSTSRITGGNKTGVFDYPWMALIAYRISNGNVEFRCGGTIINSRYILTAAHCVRNLPASLTLIGVRVGEHDLRTERDCDKDADGLETACAERYQDFSIDELHSHPSFNRNSLHNDVAVIRIRGTIDFRPDNVRPICLPIGDAAKLNQKKVVVTGWGATEYGPRSQDLLQVTLPIVPNEECMETYKKRADVWYKQMCAGGRDRKDSCSGDSGGPLQAPATYNKLNVRMIQYGIVSYGTKNCGIEGFPGVYTRVAYFLDWILDHLKP